jgi:hypothetical protein
VCLLAVVHIATMYRMVVNQGTRLNITCLQVLYTLFIPIMGMTSLPPFNTSLPPEAHTSPG